MKPSSGVRQGDGLSAIIFNLAAEPLVRRAKAKTNAGFQLLNTRLRTTDYADDISVVGSTPSGLQATINGVNRTATILGLLFNASKCSSLNISNGRANTTANLTICGVQIRALEEGEYENYRQRTSVRN